MKSLEKADPLKGTNLALHWESHDALRFHGAPHVDHRAPAQGQDARSRVSSADGVLHRVVRGAAR